MKRSLLLSLIIIFFSLSIYGQFSGEVRWTTGQGVGGFPNKHWIGDFNGDGLADKVQLVGSGDWWVALSNGHIVNGNDGFKGEQRWATNQDGGADKYFIGDFNGDGMDDILSYRISGGIWRLSLAQQSKSDGHYFFSGTMQMATNKSISITNTWVGDFNGDGIDEILYYSNGLSLFRTYGVWNIQTTKLYSSSFSFTNGYVGDFNGDGYSDFVRFETNYDNRWQVALYDPITKKFGGFVTWATGQGANSTAHFWGDVNGDGRTDKLNFYNDAGLWYVAKSTGSNFSSTEELWCTGQGVNVTGVYIGDFNGDGYCDKASYLNGGGDWWVAKVNPQTPRITAVWFSNYYNANNPTEPNNFWNINKRDGTKTPITGFGTDTTIGVYSSVDENIIRQQIKAIKLSGIDLIIVDFTNGFYKDL